MHDTILTNARLVLPAEVVAGSLSIVDGTIRAVDPGTTSVAAAEDLEGDYLIPGLVELHTDHLESHFSPRPGVAWNPIAAVQSHDAQIAASGITTVLDALRVGSDNDKTDVANHMRTLADAITAAGKAGRLRAEHFLHLRCEIASPNVVSEAEAFLDHPALKLVSVMDHTPGQRQFVSLDKFREYYKGKVGMSDAELDAFIAERHALHDRHAAPNRASLYHQCRNSEIVLASHDDATEAHVVEAIEAGVVLSEFPTTVEAAGAAHRAGLAVLMGAPNVVRGGSHSGNVSAIDLAEQGLLDVLSSDYIPFSLLHAAFVLPRRVASITLPEAIRLVTANPARSVGLDDRGEIAEGLSADLVRVCFEDDVPVVRAVWRKGKRVA
ncbi:alpha-D-ribose 1-methylphosphonate 5-triphosphate diphosphatase [Microbaculum marinisediminis]|uniref:Alpha-D-ribose 1-methylphosphonate 5-triphosphate diphosphatase n=1 Tax=Microbaculum marinisediminis TaxID=2931392 RepID=A0AAW5R6Q9_9HYPH|nr:alpha-D-ribose 1-methylphosphonate 5-triphosphate diphosphatase [Microbaculum sp. A6E488]MCT8974804.1 alpha-D-ribose 1-methylphosphonate 5-triphosphate diphosphatase [Microbaculum sp. A6E488]